VTAPITAIQELVKKPSPAALHTTDQLNQLMPQHILLVKQQLLTGHDSHLLGGVHLFNCLAEQLSQYHHTLHTFSTATREVVLHHAVIHQLLPRLRYSSSGDVVSWERSQGLTDHVAVLQTAAADERSRAAASLLAAVVQTAQQLVAATGQVGLVVLDVDTLQHAQIHNTDAASPSTRGQAACGPCCSCCGCVAATQQQQQQQQHKVNQVPFMLALSRQLLQQQPLQQQALRHACHAASGSSSNSTLAPPWQLLAVVQNIHHLPFGPCGTSPRCPVVLEAWRSISGVLCVSEFVRSYLLQHALPLLPQLQHDHVRVANPAALGVWRHGQYVSFGSAAAGRIWGLVHLGARTGAACADADAAPAAGSLQAQPTRSQGSDQQQQQAKQQQEEESCQQPPPPQQQQQQEQGVVHRSPPWQQAPVVGMLKLTKEKGSDLFVALASHLPQLQFVAVCADPDAKQQVSQAGLRNAKLVPPAGQLEELQQTAWCSC
jgi:hypothetical protein